MYPTPSSVGFVLGAQQRCRWLWQEEADVAINKDHRCRPRLLSSCFLPRMKPSKNSDAEAHNNGEQG